MTEEQLRAGLRQAAVVVGLAARFTRTKSDDAAAALLAYLAEWPDLGEVAADAGIVTVPNVA